MVARMPAFPARGGLLAEGIAAREGLPPSSTALPPINAELAKVGQKLLSGEGGFACVACHAVGDAVATQVFETEGINLVHARERLNADFFRRWLRNPLKINPMTKMPVYFDENGTSPLGNVLGGQADAQIEALWHYTRQLGDQRPSKDPKRSAFRRPGDRRR
jgi:hypothetical protein